MKQVLLLCSFLLTLIALSVHLANARRFPNQRITKLCNNAGIHQSKNFTISSSGQKIPCRRLTDAELLERYNCTGTYQEKRSAFTLSRADFNARRLIKARKPAIKKGSNRNALVSARRKLNKRRRSKGGRGRRSTPGPGETSVIDCVLRCTTDTETNNKRACGECSTVYQQPSTPRRIPKFINEQTCNPNESSDVNVSGHNIGTCVQQYIDQDFWEASGDWEWSSQFNAYIEQFVPYSHRVKSGCAFQFYDNDQIQCT